MHARKVGMSDVQATTVSQRPSGVVVGANSHQIVQLQQSDLSFRSTRQPFLTYLTRSGLVYSSGLVDERNTCLPGLAQPCRETSSSQYCEIQRWELQGFSCLIGIYFCGFSSPYITGCNKNSTGVDCCLMVLLIGDYHPALRRDEGIMMHVTNKIVGQLHMPSN